MNPNDKSGIQNSIEKVDATSILESFLPSGARIEADRLVPPAVSFEEAIAELTEYVTLHGLTCTLI